MKILFKFSLLILMALALVSQASLEAKNPIALVREIVKEKILNLNTYASIRVVAEDQEFPAGWSLLTRLPSSDLVVTGGGLEFINDAGFIHVKNPGYFKISYGISAESGQRVQLVIDGAPVVGTVLSSSVSGQMTGQSCIVYAAEKITLVSLDDLKLVGQPDHLGLYLEVTQMDKKAKETDETNIQTFAAEE